MRVLINGLPLFAKRLAEDLQERDPASSYRFLDTYNSKWAQIRYLLALPFADTVISINGVTEKSGTMEWAVRLRKRLILQWSGTDVLLALERQQNGTLYRRYIDYAHNCVDNAWMKEEVECLGVTTRWLNTKYMAPALDLVERYTELSVVSYVAQTRQEFYGMKWIIAAAEAFPGIPFTIFGTETPDFDSPANIRYMGWRPSEEMAEAVRHAAVFLRLPEHDGFAFSVIEALGAGCEVIWTMPGERALHATTSAETIETLSETLAKVEARGNIPNSENSAWALEHYEKKVVLDHYIQTLRNLGK